MYRGSWSLWYDHTETPDAQTVVIKTKFPYADAIEATAANTDGFILAKEHEESPQVNDKLMGSGPFLYTEGQPPVSWTFRKNPDYFLKPYPYVDEVVVLSTTDPVRRIANFTTGQVHMPWVVYAEERDQIKQQRPEAKSLSYQYPGSSMYMRTDKPPFNDQRLRQALSMTIDRKKIRDAVTKGEGISDQFFSIPNARVWGTRQISELGAAAKNWDYNPAEAKKLLQAAGFDKPVEANVTHYDPSVIGQWYVDQIVLSQANWRELGIANVKLTNLLGPQFAAGPRLGQYDGMALGLQGLQPPLRGSNIQQICSWGPNGEHSALNVAYINNPQLTTLAEKQIRQLNSEERKQTYRAMEPIMAENQYYIHYSTAAQTWFWDPALRNVGMPAVQGSIRYAMRWWFDKA